MSDPISDIPLEQLHESPFNPRQTFRELAALAADIKAHGRVLQPLLVRPRYPNPLRDDVTDGFEIVFGHRRYRAAELAGLAAVPCMVRALSDEEAKRAQISENLQRDDLPALEEAEGFKQLIDHHGVSVDQLVEQTGKSRSYVYGRLTLLNLCPQVRRALGAGEVGSEVALLIARLRSAKLQDKALDYIRGRGYDLKDGGTKSYRAIRELLREHFTLGLKEAIFDTADPLLLPGADACTTCPKRSGNAADYQDLAQGYTLHWGQPRMAEPNLCTDPECYAAKKKAHLQAEAAKLEAAGHEVVDGAKARAAIGADGAIKGEYLPLKDAQALLKTVKGAKVDTVTIQDPRTGKTHKAVKAEALRAAGVALQDKPKGSRGNHGDTRDWVAEREARQVKAARINARRQALLRRVHARAASEPRSLEDLRQVVAYVIDETMYGDNSLQQVAELWGHGSAQDLVDASRTMPADQLALLLLDCAWTHHFDAGGYDNEPEPIYLLETARRLGIDPDAHDEPPEPAAEPASTPSTAARALKGAATRDAGAVKHRCPATLQSWSGRGLMPRWLKTALANGKTLGDFAVPGKGKEQTDDAGSAGGRPANEGGADGDDDDGADSEGGTTDLFAEADA